MGFTAVAALVAGEAVTTTVVLAAIAEVGTVMSVVGAVTGSSDLTKLGAVMGVVGGVGSMIASGSAAGEAALSEAVQGTGTTAFDDVAANAANDAAMQDALKAGVEQVSNGAASGVSGAAADTSAQGIIGSQMNANGGVLPSTQPVSATQAPVSVQPIVQPVPSTDANTVMGATAPTTPATTDATAINTPAGVTGANPTDIRLANGTATTPGAAQKTNNFWESLSNFSQKNDALLKLGGTALSGLQTASTWNDRLALERQRMAYGNSVGNFAPTTPRPTGIIQSARTGAAS